MTADSMPPLASTPEPPYWAVIFTNERRPDDPLGYAEAAAHMMSLAAEQPGYLGCESVRDADGIGITVSYWRDPESIAAWRTNVEHQAAQAAGRERWYRAYRLRVAQVVRDANFP
jgi:heme-degrading monooxygenase HmoA